MNTLLKSIFLLFPLTMALPHPAKANQSPPAKEAKKYRTFEFRNMSSDPKANGETDFKGKTSTLSTDDRIRFLNEYTQYASQWFNVPELDQLAASPDEVKNALLQHKTSPLPSTRRSLRLNDGWKQAGLSEQATTADNAPWRTRPQVEIKDGALHLPKGSTEILDLGKSAGWRCELSWKARTSEEHNDVLWFIGNTQIPATPCKTKWQEYRLQIDNKEGVAYLSVNGKKVNEFPFSFRSGDKIPFSIKTTDKAQLTDLVFIDYPFFENAGSSKNSEIRVYEAVVLADDHFSSPITIKDWNQEKYEEAGWLPAELPCVRGGFREKGQDLYLRRQVDLQELPAQALLEIDTLDPSGEIYINGKLVGNIPDRSPQLLDVTPFLKKGNNLIAYKINHREVENLVSHSSFDKAVGWFAGRTTLHLVPSSISLREALVSTQKLDNEQKATQSHQLKLNNAGQSEFSGTLEISYRPWHPTEGESVAHIQQEISIPANSQAGFEIPLEISQPSLWSPESPQLYAVHFIIKDKSGKIMDDSVITTGIRTIAQKDGELLLNGKAVVLIGAQTMGFRPTPKVEYSAKHNRCTPIDVLMSELLAIKKMGGTLLRLHSHSAKNTPDGVSDARIAEMCDQLGIAIFWAPPGWIREGDERLIDTEQMGPHIRRLFNSPSIVLWETSNHPNQFPKEGGVERTHDFVRTTVQGILKHDQSRLIAPTTFWQWTEYANDLGTKDKKGNDIQAVPEFTHPLVTRGTQDAPTGYGAEWSSLRQWPRGVAADCIKNKIRPWLNFEHEESAAQPNWNLSGGYPWHKVRSYELPYEKGSIGRSLGFDEWKASQGWQAFSAYESMRKQILHGVAAFSWCTLEGGANSGTYEKPLLDPMGHAKLAWYIHKLLTQPLFAGSDNVDTVYGPDDKINPVIFHTGEPKTVTLTITVRETDGKVSDTLVIPNITLPAGQRVTRLDPVRLQFPGEGNCAIEYSVEEQNSPRS